MQKKQTSLYSFVFIIVFSSFSFCCSHVYFFVSLSQWNCVHLYCDLLLLFPHGISWDICFMKQLLREKSVFNIKGYLQCCSRNQLAVLPVSLCVLSSLEVLCASNNKLVSLPEEIGKLDRLMDLVILVKTLQKHCFYFREMTSGFLSVCLFFPLFYF